FGILQNYFKYAKSVFIGKSTLKKFENDGGQNPIDAAKLNFQAEKRGGFGRFNL
mgnify:CR=1